MLWTIALVGLGPQMISAPPAPVAAELVCRVLEVAYTTAIGSRSAAYPRDIQPSRRTLDLTKFVPDYKNRMALSAVEFDALKDRQALYAATDFRPLCVPTVAPSSQSDRDGHRQWVSFTNPIFSADGRLALTEVSLREEGFGYGQICIVRLESKRWSARCLQSWIT